MTLTATKNRKNIFFFNGSCQKVLTAKKNFYSESCKNDHTATKSRKNCLKDNFNGPFERFIQQNLNNLIEQNSESCENDHTATWSRKIYLEDNF